MTAKKSEHARRHVTKSTGNVFADLGINKTDAKRYLREIDQEIDAAQELKIAMAKEVKAWIKAEKLKQAEAAPILKVTRPRVSDVVNLKVTKFSLDMLVSMLTRIGKQVEMRIC